MNKLGLIVPTLNAGDLWPSWLEALSRQTRQPDVLLLIDSSSDDDTRALAQAQGFEIEVIARSDFNHGATRQQGVNRLATMDVVLFLTQDALLADANAIENLLATFDDQRVAAAYGRQLPHLGAGLIAAHARRFNYPAASGIRCLDDRAQLGIKTAFLSNSFAAYRRSALMQVGGFPCDTIANEDTYVAGKMLMAGWHIAYCAEARVFHSHDYRYFDEFKRYFDIGVFHAESDWLQRTFGGATGEGWRFVKSELDCLRRQAPWLIPSALLRTVLKGLGYRLGKTGLPQFLSQYLSLHKAYWLRSLS